MAAAYSFEKVSKNVYRISYSGENATIKLSANFDGEILLSRDMSNDGIIFLPNLYPTLDDEPTIAVGDAYKYVDTVTNVKAKYAETSIVAAEVVDTTAKNAKSLVESFFLCLA